MAVLTTTQQKKSDEQEVREPPTKGTKAKNWRFNANKCAAGTTEEHRL